MNLKKSLKRKGQAIVEYALIFGAIGILGVVSLGTFFFRVRDSVQGTATQQGYFQKATEAIIHADTGS